MHCERMSRQSRWVYGCLFACVVCAVSAFGTRDGKAAEPAVDATKLEGIIVGSPLSAVEKRSLGQLAGGMRALYGVSLATIEDPASNAIVLGKKAALRSGIITEQDLDAVRPGGFVIKTRGGSIAIAGANAYCTQYAVTALLEKLGVRQYGRKRVVTEPKTKVIPALNLSERPAFAYRNYGTRDQWADARQAADAEIFKKTDLWIDHSAGYLVPKDLYHDQHPEFFAMQADGSRIAKDDFTYHRTPLCLSNQAMVKVSVERALKWVEMQPDKTFFPITYGDTGLWCHCPHCQKLDPELGKNATRLLTWVNAVAQAIGRKYPDKTIITFAYGGSDAAPPEIRPATNVWMCASTSLGSLRFFDHCMAAGHKGMRGSIAKLDGWLAIAPEQLTVCEYQGGVYNPATLDNMASKIRYYQKRGIRGVIFSFGSPANFKPVWEHVYARLMWNPQQDALTLGREFATHYYGPAGPAICDYLELCQRRYHETLKGRKGLEGTYPEGFYSAEFCERALVCFATAHTALANDPRLKKEVDAEQQMFIMDWIEHPVSDSMDAKAKKTLETQLGRLALLAGDSPQDRIEFAREIHRVGIHADSTQKGVLAAVEAWIKRQDFPRPQAEKIAGGVRLSATTFMFAGYGPRPYSGHAHACPMKIGVAVYIGDNPANRSHRMEAEFELDELPGDGAAVLELEGQDCDHDVPAAEIRIELNGTKVFEGPIQMVKWNWSRQSFQVPPNILRKGKNKLEIINVGDPQSVAKWDQRWFMLSEAVVRFRK
ncbi:MAG: DUF4838 domain-containing protein [Pirellulaceae bacterium]|nr:DUF4838 domain-containing protein [Pirellulaceae bacterium]